jgi:hypothetical protein
MTTRPGSTLSPDAVAIWRAARVPVAIALVVVAVAVVTALVTGTGDGGVLHPEDTGAAGGRALARILAAEGVEVDLVETTADAVRAGDDQDTTLLVVRPWMLRPSQVEALAGLDAGELVLVEPDGDTLAGLAPSLGHDLEVDVTERAPGCRPLADVGTADLGGTTFTTGTGTGGTDRCYDGTLVRTTAGGRAVTVLGTGTPLHNRHLDEVGNAALSLRLLGRTGRLVWYVPSYTDPALDGERRPLSELVPAGWKFAAVQLGIAAVLLALWRSRRLGPVVAEPLPVVVRGAETIEGMARLYRRAGARDRAADALRQAATARLAAMVDGRPLADAVAHRTGRDPAAVRHLLGPDDPHDPAEHDVPADDAALVRLADALDALEKEVRRT